MTVHPRVCGEHGIDFAKGETMDGSSPRMWGTQQPGQSFVRLRRFIPAYVGNTIASGSG